MTQTDKKNLQTNHDKVTDNSKPSKLSNPDNSDEFQGSHKKALEEKLNGKTI